MGEFGLGLSLRQGTGDIWVELELDEIQAWCWDWMKCRPGVECRGGVGWTWS